MRKWLANRGDSKACITAVIQRLAKVFPLSRRMKIGVIWMRYLSHVIAALDFEPIRQITALSLRLLYKLAKAVSNQGNYKEGRASLPADARATDRYPRRSASRYAPQHDGGRQRGIWPGQLPRGRAASSADARATDRYPRRPAPRYAPQHDGGCQAVSDQGNYQAARAAPTVRRSRYGPIS